LPRGEAAGQQVCPSLCLALHQSHICFGPERRCNY